MAARIEELGVCPRHSNYHLKSANGEWPNTKISHQKVCCNLSSCHGTDNPLSLSVLLLPGVGDQIHSGKIKALSQDEINLLDLASLSDYISKMTG